MEEFRPHIQKEEVGDWVASGTVAIFDSALCRSVHLVLSDHPRVEIRVHAVGFSAAGWVVEESQEVYVENDQFLTRVAEFQPDGIESLRGFMACEFGVELQKFRIESKERD